MSKFIIDNICDENIFYVEIRNELSRDIIYLLKNY